MKNFLKMKSIFLVLMTVSISAFTLASQTPKETMEKRAKSLHETLMKSDTSAHEKFVNANYSQEFLDKVEASRHAEMLKRLNKDFSDSKIVSLKVKENKLLMLIERNSDKHRVTFDISFDPKDEYKINGMGIEAGEM